MNKKKESPPAIFGGEEVWDVVDHVEQHTAVVQRIRRAALAVTSEADWVDMSGRPYLSATGAERLRALFGISWEIEHPQITQYPDGHYDVVVKGRFSMGQSSIEVIGVRSSRDPFFSRRGGKKVPAGEVDSAAILKAAVTNCIVNGVTRLLGLRGLTWEEINVDREKVAKIKFGSKPQEEINIEELRNGIKEMLTEITGGDKEAVKRLLEKLSGWTDKEGKPHSGKKLVEDLTPAQIPIVYERVKKYYEKIQQGKEVKPNAT